MGEQLLPAPDAWAPGHSWSSWAPHQRLMDERMGHEDGSAQARYSHVTLEIRHRLMAG